jgi:hypothetical protein
VVGRSNIHISSAVHIRVYLKCHKLQQAFCQENKETDKEPKVMKSFFCLKDLL